MENKNLGHLLKEMRLERGISLREFSSDLGISHAYLSKLEKGVDPRTGKTVIPTIETLTKIAEGLSIPAKEFLELCGYFDSNTNQPVGKLSTRVGEPSTSHPAEIDLRDYTERFLSALRSTGPVICDGEPVSSEALRLFSHSVEIGLELAVKKRPDAT